MTTWSLLLWSFQAKQLQELRVGVLLLHSQQNLALVHIQIPETNIHMNQTLYMHEAKLQATHCCSSALHSCPSHLLMSPVHESLTTLQIWKMSSTLFLPIKQTFLPTRYLWAESCPQLEMLSLDECQRQKILQDWDTQTKTGKTRRRLATIPWTSQGIII